MKGGVHVPNLEQLLELNLPFYQSLAPKERLEFNKRVEIFIANKRFTAIDCVITIQDKALIAAGALLPIFRFPEYYYPQLREILLYPDTFNHDYEYAGKERNILGMVGERLELKSTMILSLKAMRQGFGNSKDGKNVVIHEFLHLIDGDDFEIDGFPDSLLDHQYSIPFMELIRKEMQKIEKNKSALDSYAGTNPAEFFAVAGELFFENPAKMEKNHPELYKMLKKVFKQD